MKITIDKVIADACMKFAEECTPTNVKRYKGRGQNNPEAIRRQIFHGKLGEWATYNYLNLKGLQATEPDMKIYKGSKKSFAADLSYKGIPINVKTQHIERTQKFGASWIFQFGSKYGKDWDHDNLLEKPEGLISFCIVYSNDLVCVESIMDAKDCIPSLLKDPVIPFLRDIKKAIYLESLKEKFGDNLHKLSLLTS